MKDVTVFFDLETSGLDLDKHEVIQFAAAAVEIDGFGGATTMASIECKVQFDESEASAEALEINGYSPDVWEAQALPRAEVVALIGAFFRRYSTVKKTSKRTGRDYKVARVAGHNIVSFDAPRLLEMFKRERGAFCPADTYAALDTLQLARWTDHALARVRTSHKLGDLAKDYGVASQGEAHDALADVRTNVLVYSAIMRDLARNLAQW